MALIIDFFEVTIVLDSGTPFGNIAVLLTFESEDDEKVELIILNLKYIELYVIQRSFPIQIIILFSPPKLPITSLSFLFLS